MTFSTIYLNPIIHAIIEMFDSHIQVGIFENRYLGNRHPGYLKSSFYLTRARKRAEKNTGFSDVTVIIILSAGKSEQQDKNA